MKFALVLILACMSFSSVAMADDICADRPSKSTDTCTVDPEHIQLETDLINVSNLNGITTTLFTNPTIRYGLTKNIDLGINIAPLVEVSDHSSKIYGIGDLYTHVEINVVNDPKWQLSFQPYIKAPTARTNIGNGAWEGGIVLPVGINLTDKIVLSLDPELDLLKDNVGSDYHLNTAQVISVAYSLPHKITVYNEIWANYNFDPEGTISQYSYDFGLAWIVKSDLEIDCGINFGLNRFTPRTQIYLGFAKHF